MLPGKLASWQRALINALMIFSGFAGLGYQSVWTQQSSLWLGQETSAILAVITAFFGGLTAGSLIFSKRIANSRKPIYWYVTSELVIASWSLCIALGLHPFNQFLLDLTGTTPSFYWQWTVAFVGSFLIFFPATIAMGATLPAMEMIGHESNTSPRSISVLYANNTLGAVLGVLSITFFLIPHLGLTHTSLICIAINCCCALLAFVFFRKHTVKVITVESKCTAKNNKNELIVYLALTGFLGIGYEVLTIHVLSQITENTVFTFSLILAVYLTGTTAGAALKKTLPSYSASPSFGIGLYFSLLSLACLTGIMGLWFAIDIKQFCQSWFGSSMPSALMTESILACFALLPATMIMGIVFSRLCDFARNSSLGYGASIGSNMLGATIAPIFFGVICIPPLGSKYSLLIVATGYVLLAAKRIATRPIFWCTCLCILFIAYKAPDLTFIDIPENGRIVSFREGTAGSVSVVEDANKVAVLRINNRQQEGSSATLRVDSRQAILPILFHGNPEHVLFLGLGTGVTSTTASLLPGSAVEVAELLPEVASASTYFTKPLIAPNFTPPKVIISDARRFVRTTKSKYDLIISDNFHPARSGSGSLYTVEHFEYIRDRLDPQGIFCQWLPLHQLDLETLKVIIRSFVTVYPHAWAILASNSLQTPVIGLVASASNEKLDVKAISRNIQRIKLPEIISNIGLDDEYAVLGSIIAGPTSLISFSQSAQLNTDDQLVVTYTAPRITYSPDSSPGHRLIELTKELTANPDEILNKETDDLTTTKLNNYWTARNKFIQSGENVIPTNDAKKMLAQVQNNLLSIIAISPDFRPAYDPLISMAKSLAETEREEAIGLLNKIIELQPNRAEALEAISEIREHQH